MRKYADLQKRFHNCNKLSWRVNRAGKERMMKLLEPLTIKGISFHNRVMFPPLTTGYEGRDGSISKQDAAFYTRLAKGGVSYIVLGDVAPVRGFTPTPKLYDDSQIESFKVLADSVHE
jgi:2,4-dienoyl-CoA reductase-like NADH-dependent reductase (Old Yellow Enzyme family)